MCIDDEDESDLIRELEEKNIRILSLQESLVGERALVTKLKEEARFKHESFLKQLQKHQDTIKEYEKRLVARMFSSCVITNDIIGRLDLKRKYNNNLMI